MPSCSRAGARQFSGCPQLGGGETLPLCTSDRPVEHVRIPTGASVTKDSNPCHRHDVDLSAWPACIVRPALDGRTAQLATPLCTGTKRDTRSVSDEPPSETYGRRDPSAPTQTSLQEPAKQVKDLCHRRARVPSMPRKCLWVPSKFNAAVAV